MVKSTEGYTDGMERRVDRGTMSTDLTFFAWADTHFGYDQRFGGEDLRGRIIEQMNDLPGWVYPAHVGGVVGAPEFVVLCGDAVDGAPGAGEEELACFRYFARRLRFRQVEVMGNHDTASPYTRYFRERYGGLSHSFDSQGIHFICLNSRYDPAEKGRFGDEELEFLDRDLRTAGQDSPVILFVHSRLDRTANGEDVLRALGGHRVLLIVGAHGHRPDVFQLEGIDCIDVGQCRDHPIDPEYGRSLSVVHVTEDRLTAVPWRWDLGEWEHGRRWADPEATARRFTLERVL